MIFKYMNNNNNKQQIDSQLLACRHITNVSEPFVWRLKLTSNEFDTLGSLIHESVRQHDGLSAHLLTPQYALVTITYLAEWYKREYTGISQGDLKRNLDIDTNGLKQLWESSGINIEKYVYQSENGSRMWQYSIFVLGGLAIQHELKRSDGEKFLKALCRIYHGEDYSLENLDEASRAIAFRQSILQKHSLYYYFREILTGAYTDEDETVKTLLINIKNANDEVLKSKFRFEWIITYCPSSSTMSRRLRMWLKPEEVGGGLHQYLSFDRMHLWGITNPEKLKILHFSIRWMNGVSIMQDINKQKPLISYSNTGDENGFVSWGIDQYAVCKSVPTMEFTHFQIIAFDDEDNEYIAQDEATTDWIQLWRIDPWKDEWSSRQSAQHQTAVLFDGDWHIDTDPDAKLSFTDRIFGESKKWNFCYISSDITIRNQSGKEITLYNRTGYDQIYAKLYKETISYADGGLVSYVTEDEEEGEVEEKLPLIFGKEDVCVRHFATKDAIQNVEMESDSTADKVEFKTANGRYQVWNDLDSPDYGINTLRIIIKGMEYKLDVIYVPGPVVRDLEHEAIIYKSVNGKQITCEDKIVLDKTPLVPTIPIQIGHTVLNVYRPTDIKEIYLDGNVHTYRRGEPTTIPYILKDRVMIADFSKKGYSKYKCNQLNSVFSLTGGNDNSALACWETGKTWPASRLDKLAPDWLNVSIGNNRDADKSGLRFFIGTFMRIKNL
jgi:hypothetical protein